jgi:hypothetical protein
VRGAGAGQHQPQPAGDGPADRQAQDRADPGGRGHPHGRHPCLGRDRTEGEGARERGRCEAGESPLGQARAGGTRPRRRRIAWHAAESCQGPPRRQRRRLFEPP